MFVFYIYSDMRHDLGVFTVLFNWCNSAVKTIRLCTVSTWIIHLQGVSIITLIHFKTKEYMFKMLYAIPLNTHAHTHTCTNTHTHTHTHTQTNTHNSSYQKMLRIDIASWTWMNWSNFLKNKFWEIYFKKSKMKECAKNKRTHENRKD